MKAIPHYKLNWITEDEADEEWLPGEQIPHFCYCNNKTELKRRHQQAVTEGGYNFSVDVWCWNQYMASNIGEEWDQTAVYSRAGQFVKNLTIFFSLSLLTFIKFMVYYNCSKGQGIPTPRTEEPST